MLRTKQQGLENQQVERALQQGDAVVGTGLGRHPTQASHRSGRMSTQKGKGKGQGPSGVQQHDILYMLSSDILYSLAFRHGSSPVQPPASLPASIPIEPFCRLVDCLPAAFLLVGCELIVLAIEPREFSLQFVHAGEAVR